MASVAGWRKVDDTPESMPPKGRVVLVWVDSGNWRAAFWSGSFWFHFPVASIEDEIVTHWQFGPEAPQPEQMRISDVVEDIIIP
jgi:hypothetical protein